MDAPKFKTLTTILNVQCLQWQMIIHCIHWLLPLNNIHDLIHSRKMYESYFLACVGALNAVTNPSYIILDPGLSINVTWIAPFTLDIADTDRDIIYCINATFNGNMLDLGEGK